MTTITFTIPTSWKEWRQYLKEKTSAKHRHNVNVLWNFVLELEKEVNNNYWKNDITSQMKKHVFKSDFRHSKIFMLYSEARKNLR